MGRKLGNILPTSASSILGNINQAQCHLGGNGDGGAADSGLHRGCSREALCAGWGEGGGEEER
jgi:hypothetical protein